MRARRLLDLLVPVACSAALLACSGKVTRDDEDGSPASGGSSASGGTSSGGSGGTSGRGGGSGSGSGGTGGTAPGLGGVSPSTRVARLTHEQYKNTVRDLFGISDDPTAEFAPDALNGFAYDTSADFRVDARLGPQYRAAAETLAARAVSDAAVRARVVPCSGTDSSCADSFIQSFGRSAFRRPLTSTEAMRFRTLFDQGSDLVASGNDFDDGVRLVVEAMLQSPQFLYRTETSDQVGGDGLIALDSFELASRLSYTLWNTLPDAELAGLADTGALTDASVVRTQAERLLADPRAVTKAVSFHAQAFQFSRYGRIAPDKTTYPNAPSDMITRTRDASERFVQEIFSTGGGISEILTAPYAFADSALAPLYGKSVSGGLTRVDFAPGERQGLLMQVGFLASNAYSIKTDPIHRGLFVLRNLLCRQIPDPPPGAAQTPPPATDTPPKTTRDEVSLLTGQPTCVGCHSEINAPGFAFEAFDAIGEARATENGVAVDTTGTLELDGQPVSFDGANELVEALAASPEAHVCYAGNWIQFALGRRLTSEDQPLEAALSDASLGARDLVAELTSAPAFLERLPNEVGP